MDDDNECIHGLGPMSACVICNGRTVREMIEDAKVPVNVITTRAKFDSQCPECNLPIHLGQQIAWFPGNGATHAACFFKDF